MVTGRDTISSSSSYGSPSPSSSTVWSVMGSLSISLPSSPVINAITSRVEPVKFGSIWYIISITCVPPTGNDAIWKVSSPLSVTFASIVLP